MSRRCLHADVRLRIGKPGNGSRWLQFGVAAREPLPRRANAAGTVVEYPRKVTSYFIVHILYSHYMRPVARDV